MRSIGDNLRGEFTRLDEILLSAGGDRATIKSRIIAFLFSGIFFMGGVAVLYAATLYPLVKYLGSGDWEEIVATITESKLDWDEDSARVDIKYKYRINGTDHTGDRYGWINDRQNFGIGEKKKIIDRYKVGSPTNIWFDPNEPSESVVDRSHTGITGTSLLFPIPFLLVGICGLSYAFLGGVAAARTRKLMGLIVDEAESKGLGSLAEHLRHPPQGRDRSRKLIFTMAQGKVEGLGLLFAAIFWNGIVGVFLSLLVGFIISGEGMALFLGLFLIPFVIIGVLLIVATVGKFRAPRPPAFVIGFLGLSLEKGEMEIPVTWMRLEKGGKSPDASNIRLSIGRDLAINPFSFGKPKKSPDGGTEGYIPIDDAGDKAVFALEAVPRDPKTPAWKIRKVQDLSAIFEWEEQPRREKRTATWSLIAEESD